MNLSRRRFLFAAPAIVAVSSLMVLPRPRRPVVLPTLSMYGEDITMADLTPPFARLNSVSVYRLNSVSVYRHGRPVETWTPPEPLRVGYNESVAVRMDAGRIVGVEVSGPAPAPPAADLNYRWPEGEWWA